MHIELPISVPEAVVGREHPVPTIARPVRVTAPAGSNTGRSLKLKARGLGRPDGRPGDQFVRLLVVLPERRDAELEPWARRHNYDVRRNHDPR